MLVGEGETDAGEIVKEEVPLVRKKRRLVKAGETGLAQERVAVESTGPSREGVDQEVSALGEKEGAAGVGEEGQVALPLVMVPFEAVPEEEPPARRKQAIKARRLQAMTVA